MLGPKESQIRITERFVAFSNETKEHDDRKCVFEVGDMWVCSITNDSNPGRSPGAAWSGYCDIVLSDGREFTNVNKAYFEIEKADHEHCVQCHIAYTEKDIDGGRCLSCGTMIVGEPATTTLPIREVKFVMSSDLPQHDLFFEQDLSIAFGDMSYGLISKDRMLEEIANYHDAGGSLDFSEMIRAVEGLTNDIYIDLEN